MSGKGSECLNLHHSSIHDKYEANLGTQTDARFRKVSSYSVFDSALYRKHTAERLFP
jgi:hypothetical protein